MKRPATNNGTNHRFLIRGAMQLERRKTPKAYRGEYNHRQNTIPQGEWYKALSFVELSSTYRGASRYIAGFTDTNREDIPCKLSEWPTNNMPPGFSIPATRSRIFVLFSFSK